MEIKRFTRYNKLGTRQIVGLLIIIALIVIFAYVILCQNDNIVFTIFFAVPFKVAEFIIDDNGIEIILGFFIFIFWAGFLFFVPPSLLVLGLMLCFSKSSKQKANERTLLNLAKKLEWKSIPREICIQYNFLVRYTKYAIADVRDVSELQKNGEQIIFLRNRLLKFSTNEETIIILSNSNLCVFLEDKKFIEKFAEPISPSEKQLSIQQKNNTIIKHITPLKKHRKLYKSQIIGIVLILTSIIINKSILMFVGIIMCCIKSKEYYTTQKELFNLTKELKWNVVTTEIRSEYAVPVRYIRYTVADVNDVSEFQINGKRIILLGNSLYRFNIESEKIIIFSDSKQFVFSEYYGCINSDLSLENSTISQIGEN